MQTTYRIPNGLGSVNSVMDMREIFRYKTNLKQDSNFDAFTSLDLILYAGLTIQNLVRFAHNRKNGILE